MAEFGEGLNAEERNLLSVIQEFFGTAKNKLENTLVHITKEQEKNPKTVHLLLLLKKKIEMKRLPRHTRSA